MDHEAYTTYVINKSHPPPKKEAPARKQLIWGLCSAATILAAIFVGLLVFYFLSSTFQLTKPVCQEEIYVTNNHTAQPFKQSFALKIMDDQELHNGKYKIRLKVVNSTFLTILRINLDEEANGSWSLMAITADGESNDYTFLQPPGLPRNQWFYMIITQNIITQSYTITLQVDNETYTVVIFSQNEEDLKHSIIKIGYALNHAPYVLAFNC